MHPDGKQLEKLGELVADKELKSDLIKNLPLMIYKRLVIM